MKFFGWDGGKQRDHQAPSLKQKNSRHEKSAAGAAGAAGAAYRNYKSSRRGRTSSSDHRPPDFEDPSSSFRSLFSKCDEESFSSTVQQQQQHHASYSQCFSSSTVQQHHASYSQTTTTTTTAHVKRCDSRSATTVVLEEEGAADDDHDEDAADWEGRLQESIRVVFSYEQKGLLAIGTFALDEVSTLRPQRNPPPATAAAAADSADDDEEQALLLSQMTDLEMHETWLQETRVLVAEPDDENNDDITMQRSVIQVYNADTLLQEDKKTNIAAAAQAKACEGLATMTIYQAPKRAEKQAEVDKHQKGESKKELSRSVMRKPDDDGHMFFHGLRKQVFPLPPNCWAEALTELPIYTRASKPKDFSAYTTSFACGLFSANSFRKLRKMWLGHSTPHRRHQQQQRKAQTAALCNNPDVGDGQEMVSSAPPGKDTSTALAKQQSHAARRTANWNRKGKQQVDDGSHIRHQQHCECSTCKEQYMMDLCRYVNRKLRRDYNIPDDENGHWITTDSEYLILEM